MFDKLISDYLKKSEMGDFGVQKKIFLFREIAYLIEGGVSILDAMHTIQNTSDSGSVKHICGTIAKELGAGQSLSKSLTKLHRYFNDGDISIIRSGESTGELIKVLKQLAKEYEFITYMQGKFTSAMIYPVILFVLSIAATFYMFIGVLPSIFDIIKDFDNVSIPPLTMAMINFTDFFKVNYLNIIGVIGIICVGLFIYYTTEQGRKRSFEFFLSIPTVGTLIKYFYMVKFFRYLKLMQTSGMNYIDIFVYLRQIMDMPMYQQAIESVLSGIKKGETIYSNLRYYTNIIPADVMVLIKVGEQTASLGNTLENIVVNYHEELEKRMNDLSKFIEPIVIVFMGTVIMMIALSVFGVIGSILDAAQNVS